MKKPKLSSLIVPAGFIIGLLTWLGISPDKFKSFFLSSFKHISYIFIDSTSRELLQFLFILSVFVLISIIYSKNRRQEKTLKSKINDLENRIIKIGIKDNIDLEKSIINSEIKNIKNILYNSGYKSSLEEITFKHRVRNALLNLRINYSGIYNSDNDPFIFIIKNKYILVVDFIDPQKATHYSSEQVDKYSMLFSSATNKIIVVTNLPLSSKAINQQQQYEKKFVFTCGSSIQELENKLSQL
ncbi:MAG: hypothetical protein JW747_00600 [Candidatus Aminicenantes bacterium]|nr:hypothetical protein [Candidatus Aminicenantes bacterium]